MIHNIDDKPGYTAVNAYISVVYLYNDVRCKKTIKVSDVANTWSVKKIKVINPTHPLINLIDCDILGCSNYVLEQTYTYFFDKNLNP